MSDLATTILAQVPGLWGAEGIAVACAMAYLLLAIRQNIWCWFFAGISTAIFVYLFFGARLYMESALNVFYFVMAIYGWYVWRYAGHKVEPHVDNKADELGVTVWPMRTHTTAIATILLVSGISGYCLDSFTDAEYPYVDSLTSWGAIWATFLVARKVLENWWYWLLIDAASVFIYWSRGLELSALLFIVYLLMIPFGFISWRRSMIEAAA